jgi:transposase
MRSKEYAAAVRAVAKARGVSVSTIYKAVRERRQTIARRAMEAERDKDLAEFDEGFFEAAELIREDTVYRRKA